jgi:hypothetical protein
MPFGPTTNASAGTKMDDRERARRRGRRFGLAVFLGIVGIVTAIWATQVLAHVWSPEAPPTKVACRPGVASLFDALTRARRAASEAPGGERVALERFRAALAPEWDYRPTMSETCAEDAEAQKALVVLDKLRYAEENAARYEATSLAALRRRARKLEARLPK